MKYKCQYCGEFLIPDDAFPVMLVCPKECGDWLVPDEWEQDEDG